MNNSNYQDFMACYEPLRKITHAMLCGVVLWEHIQACDESEISYTEIVLDAVTEEVNRRLLDSNSEIYAMAMMQWAQNHYEEQVSEETDAAADMGGCNSIPPNNTT